MKSYVFRVIVEPDEGRWLAYVPELESRGAVTWEHTRDEALRNIQEVSQMVVESMIDEGEPLPEPLVTGDQAAVAVNVA